MKKFLKKYTHIIIYFILGLYIIVNFIQYSKINHLESRIDTVNNSFHKLVIKDKTLTNQIKYQQFKEDSYLKQQDRDTNLILWFVAIVFGLFGLISFTSFNKRIEHVENDFKDRYENQISDIEILSEQYKKIKADLHAESSTIYGEKANTFFQAGNLDFYVFYELLSGARLADTYMYYKDKNPDLAESYVTSLISNYILIISRIENKEPMAKIEKKTFHLFTTPIRQIDNIEVNDLITKIHSLIRYKE